MKVNYNDASHRDFGINIDDWERPIFGIDISKNALAKHIRAFHDCVGNVQKDGELFKIIDTFDLIEDKNIDYFKQQLTRLKNKQNISSP